MVIVIVERAPVSLRGELTRWLLEPRAGVFVGRVSALVREKLWEKITTSVKKGAAILVWTTDNEQGFAFRLHGDPSRSVRDFDGLSLVRVPAPRS